MSSCFCASADPAPVRITPNMVPVQTKPLPVIMTVYLPKRSGVSYTAWGVKTPVGLIAFRPSTCV